MKILLISIGTRGDMEPLLAIGEILKNRGHKVVCAFPEQFRRLADKAGVEFASLGNEFIDMLSSDIGKLALGGSSGIRKYMAYIKFAKESKGINKKLMERQYKIIEDGGFDRILYNSKVIYPLIWERKNKGKTIMISPVPYMHYVKGHTHVAFNKNLGEFFNRFTFKLVDFGMVTTIKVAMKWLKIKEKISRKELKGIISDNRFIYTISPILFRRPEYWRKDIKVLGYVERNKRIGWEPGKELGKFMEKNKKILFITFGSMTNPDPKEKTRIIMDILYKHKIPAIINKAGGGFVEPEVYNRDLVHFVDKIPYDWILPRVYGAIHHGGSGTTHLALKYGCVTMIIPHIIDQFVWDRIIAEEGVGPRGVNIYKLGKSKVEEKIVDLYQNPGYKKKAIEISRKLKKEDFKEELYREITK